MTEGWKKERVKDFIVEPMHSGFCKRVKNQWVRREVLLTCEKEYPDTSHSQHGIINATLD